MTDLKSVIKGFECALGNYPGYEYCRTCAYHPHRFGQCKINAENDALVLLKEHEKEVEHLNDLIRRRDAIIEDYHKADTFLAVHGWKWKTNE